jgi:hypothetical protein
MVVVSTQNALSLETSAFLSQTKMRKFPYWHRIGSFKEENRYKHYDRRTYVLLHNKLDHEEEPIDDTSMSTTPTTPLKEDSNRTFLRNLLLQINFGFAYIMIALGILLTAGLVLNLFGFGYQITPEGQLRIDTITQLREEAQFRREVFNSMQEYRQEQKALLPKHAVSD